MNQERVVKFTASQADEGVRVDKAVLLHADGISRSRVQHCIDSGQLLLNGLPTKPSATLRRGDKVALTLTAREPLELVSQDIPLTVLFQDEYFAVIDKPAGLVVHPGAGVADGTLANALLHRFGRLPGTQQLRPGLVHRLDKETSGLLLVTLTEESQLRFARLFHDRKMYKEYTALVHGAMEARHGIIDKPIGRHPVHRTKMTTHAPRSRACRTEWSVAEEFPGFTLLHLVLHTGRTHQIRVHLSSLGRSVVGDNVYGPGRTQQIRDTRVRRAVEALGRFFLHARCLRFTHPFTGREMEFTSPLPPELARLLTLLGEN